MPVIPGTPVFSANAVASIASLSSLSTLVKLGAQYQIAWKVYNTTSSTLAANTLNTLTWNAAAWNGDTNWSTGSATRAYINTQGFYDVWVQLNWNAANTGALAVQVVATTGPNAPGGAGVSTTYNLINNNGFAADVAGAFSGGIIVGQQLYVQDYLTVIVDPATASFQLLPVGSGQTANGSSSTDYAGIQDGGCWFSGRLVSIGGTP